MQKHYLLVKPDNTIETPGFDYGPCGIQLSYRVSNAVVLKWAGVQFTNRTGTTTYKQAEWIVGVVVTEKFRGEDLIMNIEEISSMDVTRFRRKTFDAACALADSYASHKPFQFECPVCSDVSTVSADGKNAMTVACSNCMAETMFVNTTGSYEPKKKDAEK